MLRAVVFDFDGVIADDEMLHLEGFRRALRRHGVEVSDRDYFERYVGLDDHDGFAAMLRDGGREADEATVARLMIEKARAFSELARRHATIFPGVETLLEDLRSGAEPLAVAIASGALRDEIALILKLAGLESYFSTIVSADDAIPGKPDPAPFDLARRRLASVCPGLEAAQCVAIEDTTAGLASARAAGMVTVGVTNTCAAERLQADLVVDSLERVDRRRLEALAGAGKGR